MSDYTDIVRAMKNLPTGHVFFGNREVAVILDWLRWFATTPRMEAP